MTTPASEPDLTFQWPVEKGFPFILFVCVSGSLLAHMLTFFLFQVVYPQRVTIPQPAPHVSLLTASSPENIALLRWIDAEDPALIAGDNSVVPPDLAEVHYQPSFAAPRTAPLSVPVEKTEGVPFPPAVDRLSPETGATVPEVSAVPGRPTAVQFSGALTSRALVENPVLTAPHLAMAPVGPTVLLVGVNERGEVRYQILQPPLCGEPKLDELAVAHLRRLRFAPAETPMTWAYVTFAWGVDVYAEAGGSPRTR
jgi:hypothetical protein